MTQEELNQSIDRAEMQYEQLKDTCHEQYEEIQELKQRIYKARKMIFDNYGVLDKYEIEMLDDILKGDKENE